MLAVPPVIRHDELEQIVEELPSNAYQGPASRAGRNATCKIHCTNPEDMIRVRKIKHFQEYVVEATKETLIFAVDALQTMFPDGAMHTKLLLGSVSAIDLLSKSGATHSKDPRIGQVLSFTIDRLLQKSVVAMATKRDFADPFSTCDLHPTTPATTTPLTVVPTVPSHGGVGFWQSYFVLGNADMWKSLLRTGTKPFLQGLVIGFVDEVLGNLIPARYHNKLNYIKNLVKGASALIGTAVLCLMIARGEISLLYAIITVIVSYAGGMVGGAVGAALSKLLLFVKDRYFPSSPPQPPTSDVLQPPQQPLQSDSSQHSYQYSELQHECGAEDNNYLDLGLCMRCNTQPALFGFVHKGDDVAHSAFCLPCSTQYKYSTCVCRAEVSSIYYFDAITPTCASKTCIMVGGCVTCDEVGGLETKTAQVWRLKKSEETCVTKKTVVLDVRYCLDHIPLVSHRDLFRYGKLYSTGHC